MRKKIIFKHDILVDDFTDENCKKCLEDFTVGYGTRNCCLCVPETICRTFRQCSANQTLYLCDKECNTTRNFKNKSTVIWENIASLSKVFNETKKGVDICVRGQFTDFRHNLKSITAHAIQSLDTLINQNKILEEKEPSTAEIIETAIRSNIEDAATNLLQISKYFLSMKAEFNSYEALHGITNDSRLINTSVNPRNVIMIVLYMFFKDFSKKKVRVSIDSFFEKVRLDFETFQVANFYLIENALKYTKSSSELAIALSINKNELNIEYKMTSLYLSDDDAKHIFDQGYSGDMAKKASLSGSGLGMYNAYKLLELMNGSISIDPGEICYTDKEGLEYAKNNFIIKLPYQR